MRNKERVCRKLGFQPKIQHLGTPWNKPIELSRGAMCRSMISRPVWIWMLAYKIYIPKMLRMGISNMLGRMSPCNPTRLSVLGRDFIDFVLWYQVYFLSNLILAHLFSSFLRKYLEVTLKREYFFWRLATCRIFYEIDKNEVKQNID